MILNNAIKSSKICITMFILNLLTGCATSTTSDRISLNTYSSDVQERVIRSIATRDEWAINKRWSFSTSPGPGLTNRKNWNDNAKLYRWVYAYTRTGPVHYSGYNVNTFALIADGVPQTIEKGDILDVLYMKEEYGYDLGNLKSNIVLKLVCKYSDDECISNIKKSNKWGLSYGYEIKYPEDFIKSLKFTKARTTPPD